MVTESGKQNLDLKKSRDLTESGLRRMLEEDHLFVQFFQAVRLLERLYPERNPVGLYVSPSSEVVRFSSRPTLSFPAGELDSLKLNQAAPHAVQVNFMGLSAAVGALPHPYTEYLLERTRAKDRGPAAFFDLFNHRILSLFYRSWEKYRFFIAYERKGTGEDAISARLLDLLGLGTAGLRNRMDIPDEAALYYTGLLAQKTRSARGLKQILEDYFDVAVEIEQFTGSWNRLPVRNQTFLTETYSFAEKLGFGAMIGDEVWDQSGKVTVRLGPMPFAQYREFLPGAQGCRELASWLRLYGNRELVFVVQLVLAREEVPGLHLGETGPSAGRLGLVSWIKNRDFERDPDEAFYEVH
jgi:type VI secretion system protein ImpH